DGPCSITIVTDVDDDLRRTAQRLQAARQSRREPCGNRGIRNAGLQRQYGGNGRRGIAELVRTLHGPRQFIDGSRGTPPAPAPSGLVPAEILARLLREGADAARLVEERLRTVHAADGRA